MKTIQISDSDYEFLKKLKEELNTQDTDGTANPRFWSIMETREEYTHKDWGNDIKIYVDGESVYNLEEFVEEIENHYSHNFTEGVMKEWNAVDKNDYYEVVTFCQDFVESLNVDVVGVIEKQVIGSEGGPFLTKKACKDYIERYKYNLSKPVTYCNCAFRNEEYGKLLDILSNLEL